MLLRNNVSKGRVVDYISTTFTDSPSLEWSSYEGTLNSMLSPPGMSTLKMCPPSIQKKYDKGDEVSRELFTSPISDKPAIQLKMKTLTNKSNVLKNKKKKKRKIRNMTRKVANADAEVDRRNQTRQEDSTLQKKNINKVNCTRRSRRLKKKREAGHSLPGSVLG